MEHAFVDDDSDFENYLSSDAKLKVLAEADAKGIARYYQLTTEDGKKAESPLENYKEKIVHIVDGNSKHNKISYKTYYPSSKKETERTPLIRTLQLQKPKNRSRLQKSLLQRRKRMLALNQKVRKKVQKNPQIHPKTLPPNL